MGGTSGWIIVSLNARISLLLASIWATGEARPHTAVVVVVGEGTIGMGTMVEDRVIGTGTALPDIGVIGTVHLIAVLDVTRTAVHHPPIVPEEEAVVVVEAETGETEIAAHQEGIRGGAIREAEARHLANLLRITTLVMALLVVVRRMEE